MRKFIHIDMDCFYAAVEMRDNPEYRNIPIAVGGQSKRGVLSTCNYIAREFGVRSAMPNAQAMQLCPKLTIVSGRMEVYKEVSAHVREIFGRYTDKIEPLSLDEAYLDVSDSKLFQGSATLIANDIRATIERETGLTASAGIAPNKFLAKIASDENKPNGFCVIAPDEVADFAYGLDLKKIPGVGKVTLQKLHELGLHVGADVLACSPMLLSQHFGQFAQVLIERAKGIDNRELCLERMRKSVGVEHTYEHNLKSLVDCEQEIQPLYEQLRLRLERTGLKSKVNKLGVKVKFADFTATTVDQSGQQMDMAVFLALLAKGFERGRGKQVRLLGLNVGLNAGNEGEQSSNQLLLPFE